MTEEQARKILGIRSNCPKTKAEQIYHEKRKCFQRQLIPGILTPDREKAQADLAALSSAWETLHSTPGRTRNAKSVIQPPPGKPKQKPQRLGDAWEEFLHLLPISEPAVIAVVVASLILFIVVLKNIL
jgi:hypothetical protein